MSQTEMEWLAAFLVIVPISVMGLAALGQMLWWDYQDEKIERAERERVLQQMEDHPGTLTNEQFRVLLRRS